MTNVAERDTPHWQLKKLVDQDRWIKRQEYWLTGQEHHRLVQLPRR
jgi:hypothetical protein